MGFWGRLMDWRFLFTLCILGWAPSSIHGDTDPGDAAALNAMYMSLSSPSQLSQWTASGNDPCGQSWKGVTCSGNRVTEIKISSLQVSGSLGFMLDKMTSVTTLDVSNNNIGGDLPYQLPPNLQQLNLANNQITGSIPYSVSNMISLKSLNTTHNKLSSLGDFYGKLASLSTLDVSYNNLTGNLPQSFSSLSSMTSMYLENNNFTGTIGVLANLPLESLNIANNQFTGWIPQQLRNINLQKDGNAFTSGPAPQPPPGTPPAARPSKKHPSNSGDGDSGKKSGIGAGGVIGIVISILVVGAIVAFFLVKKRSKRSSSDIEKPDNQPFAPLASNQVQEMKAVQNSSTVDTKAVDTPAPATISLRPPPIARRESLVEEEVPKTPVVVKKANINVRSYSIADLQMATGSFSVENLLGEGSFGRVYRAQFDDGKVLAVKKIHSSALPQELSEDMSEIVSDISRLHHPNVTELMGYCSEHKMHLLVYEFHKNGSLHDFMHIADEYNKPLTWNSRVKIALGTARALEYLHEVCSPSVVHQNIKSANILLDAELNPHLSDAGLASLIPNADQTWNEDTSAGYSAPEVAMSGQYNLKSDVYSFGVVMLELISGRKPFDSSRPRSEQSLVGWGTPQLHDIDALSKMVDPALEGLYPVKSLSRFADVIALCVQPEPEFRPPMSEVVQALVRLVQRTNMSRRTTGSDLGASHRADDANTNEYTN